MGIMMPVAFGLAANLGGGYLVRQWVRQWGSVPGQNQSLENSLAHLEKNLVPDIGFSEETLGQQLFQQLGHA